MDDRPQLASIVYRRTVCKELLYRLFAENRLCCPGWISIRPFSLDRYTEEVYV